MTTVEQLEATPIATQAAVEPPAKRPRAKDRGPQILPHMEHFVQLTRKLQRPPLIRALVEGVLAAPLPALGEVSEGARGVLPIASRNAVFTAIADLGHAEQGRIERAAERVILLGDEYGTLAVSALLDASDPQDAAILQPPADKFSRALYLYLRQALAGDADPSEDRFDHAEHQQGMLQQSQSEKYASHYLGPKGAQPTFEDGTEQALKRRLMALFPGIDPDDVLVECFAHRDTAAPGNPIVLFTLTAQFNGSEVHYRQVANGEVLDIESPAVTDVRYGWQAGKGELSVFCDDIDVRPELATLFRDVVLGGDGDLSAMPMREFDLMGFGTPAMLKRFTEDRIEGIESIEIKQLIVAKPRSRRLMLRGRPIERRVANDLVIRRHRFEERDIYAIASEEHGIPDLTAYVIRQVKLTLRIGKSAHRRAHNASVQITAPNGFSHRRVTQDDSERVFAQLLRLGCARQY